MSAAWRNRVELVGTVASEPKRRRTPAGTPVLTFRLRVEASPSDPAVAGCVIPIVVFGDVASSIVEGAIVEIAGSLTERRSKSPGSVRQSRFEILARTARVL